MIEAPAMHPSLIVMDEASVRRIVGEELDSRLAPIVDAVRALRSDPAEPDLLGRKDLAARLGVGSRTLRRLELAGLLPTPIRSSQRACWWPRSTIDSWMASGGHVQARTRLHIRKKQG